MAVVWQTEPDLGQPLGKTNSNFVELIGDAMTGPLILSGDPVAPLQAVTKQYVDLLVSGAYVDAPADGNIYARVNNTWEAIVDGGIY